MSSQQSSNNWASMSAARDSSKTAPPTKDRDGFSLIPTTPIHYDVVPNMDFLDITYHISTGDQCARIAFNRPEILNAFRPRTIREIQMALEHATDDTKVGAIVLTSNISKDYTPAFCAGGDQHARGDGGYQDGTETAPKLRVLDLQIQMRRCPKPIVAVVRGYAIGGGHILHMVADLTLASTNAVFGQTGSRMGSFDAGYGSTHMARLIGQKRARELWFLNRFYNAQEACDMGLINAVYPDQHLDNEAARWIRRIIMNSPTALACTKAALNADEDGAAGIQQLGGHLTSLFYKTEESREGKQAFFEKRPPNFRKLPLSKL